MKLILRLLHAKLAFHPLSPKKKHCINAHYAETWGFSNRLPFCCFRLRFRLRSSPHLLRSFLGFIPSSPVLRLRCPHFAHARAHSRVHSRTPAPPPISVFAFTLHRSIPTHCLSTHKELNISPTPFPSPSLSQFSPTGYGKVPLFPTLPPYFSRHSPCLANCKISHRAGEGIFLKAFTPYALIYCTLRPTGEEVKEKNETSCARAREGTRKTHLLHLVASRRGRTFASRTLQRLFSSCHIAFPSFATKPNHVAERKENACTLTLAQHNVGHAHGFLTQNTTNSQFLTTTTRFHCNSLGYIYIYICISSKSSSP